MESVMITLKDGYHLVESAVVRNFHKVPMTPNVIDLKESAAEEIEVFDAFQLSDPYDVTYEILWEKRLKN
jgi:hypothetical protein